MPAPAAASSTESAPSRTPLLEICVDGLAGAAAAARGGADRIELCSALGEGGLTPSLGLLEEVLAEVALPVHCMVRPRGGGFCYSPGELRIMERDILLARSAGAAGVVLGILTPAGRVDVAATRRLAAAARPMRVTFHRAFDAAEELDRALEDVIATGADILLTSGGSARLPEGAAAVAGLVAQAHGRIAIMGGSGVRVQNAAALCAMTGVDALHGSLRRPAAERERSLPDAPAAYELLEEDVRALAAVLRGE